MRPTGTVCDVTVSEIGERGLLARIRARLPRPAASVIVDIGDDAAVVAPARNAHAVLTTDALIEGVHFDRRFSTPADIGHKALAVNLSDLAAMGATPRWALLSLALAGDVEVADVDALVDGFVALAREHGVTLVGGNLSRSPGPMMVDVTAVGASHPRRVLTRSGGRAGDGLYVSGTIGGAAAGLEMLATGSTAPAGATCIERHRRPSPRVRLGRTIAQSRAARAAMDLSDGLADALHQIAEASGCGVEVDVAALPIAAEAYAWWTARGEDPVLKALGGSDDYELLIAVPPSWQGRLRHVAARVSDPPLTRIGVLTRDPGEHVLIRNGRREELPRGFVHW